MKIDQQAAEKRNNGIEGHDEQRKIRRAGFKLRIGKVVDLVMTNVYQDKKYKSSYDYKKTVYPIEINAIMKVVNDSKASQDERNKKNEELKEILRREDPKVDSVAGMKLGADITVEKCMTAGLYEEMISMKFFSAYVRASMITVIRQDKIKSIQDARVKSMSEEKKKIQKTIEENLDKTIEALYENVDLK